MLSSSRPGTAVLPAERRREVTVRLPDLARLRADLAGLGRLAAPALIIGPAVVYVAAIAAERLAEPLSGWREVSTAWALTLVIAGALLARRRYPLTAFIAATVALCAEPLLDVSNPVSPYAHLLCVYSVAAYATRSRALWAPAITVASVIGYFAALPGTSPFESAGVLVVWLATWALGYGTARRREEQEAARRAVRLQVVAEERTRMARELHDLIGHTVNLMVVQAGAARLMLDRDPAMTSDLLTGVEKIGREALVDLDQVLGNLRANDPVARMDEADRQPTPGLARLPDLVSRLEASGVDVTLSMDSALHLPRNLDLSAYRIVQEALTNTLKHAAPCAATVVVRQDARTVVVEVSDEGPGPSNGKASGRGLLGIAERVSMHGGVVEHGGGERGGFTVRAVLPLP